MAWTTIPNTDIDQDSPVTQPLMTAIRDNIEWVNPFISTTDFSNDATSDHTLSIDYDVNIFSLQNIIPATDSQGFYMRFSTDGGTTFETTSYKWSELQIPMNGTTLTSSSTGSATFIRVTSALVGSDTNESGVSGTVIIHGAHLAQKTMVQSNVTYLDNSNIPVMSQIHGLRNIVEDTDAVRFYFASGNIESGTITHYGWRNDG